MTSLAYISFLSILVYSSLMNVLICVRVVRARDEERAALAPVTVSCSLRRVAIVSVTYMRVLCSTRAKI